MAHITYHDVSHFQGRYQPTGPTCAKATEGASYTDPEFAGIRRRTKARGWPFLAYHFLAHGSVASQVSHVISVVGRNQPLMLDVEAEPGASTPTLSDVYAFADQYKSRGGLVTLAYIPHWFWSGSWGSPSLTGLTTRGIGLVSSLYTTYSDNGPGWASYGGVAPVVWQYTDTPLDTNAFKGTVAELGDLWQNGTSMADATLSLATQQSIADNVLIRDGHIQNYNDPADNVSLATWSAQINAAIKALNTAVAAIPTTTLPAGPLTDADKDDIAVRVANLIYQRMAP